MASRNIDLRAPRSPSGSRPLYAGAPKERPVSVPARSDRGPAATALRLLWMIGAPVALVIVAALIAADGPGGFAVLDVAYVAIAASAVAARWLDIRRFEGQTLDGRRASPRDFYPYAIKVVIGAIALWLAVRVWSGG